MTATPPLRGRFLPCALAAVTFLAALLSASPPLQAAAPKVEQRTLANGLSVVLEEDHAAPVVAVQVWVKAGSRYETDAEAGITHLIEHMIFKGTERHGPGELARAIEASGGYINAYTSFDQTVYHTVLASRYLELGLDVLSDAVCGSLFDPAELEREKQVVIEEIRQRDDEPEVRLSKKLFATAYQVHPYRRPVIGFEETVAGFSRDDVMAYLSKWYWPGNMTLVVVGDVKAAEAWGLIEKTFGQASYPGEGRKMAAAQTLTEPVQEAARTAVLGGDVNEAYLDIAFHIPAVAHEDTCALDVLADILGEGASSRLYREVKQEQELVHEVDAAAFTPLDPGLFFISAALEAAKTPAALPALLAEAFKLQSQGPSAEELAKAKLNIEAEFLRGRETVEGRARQLGYFQTVRGDWRLEAAYLARIRAVSAEDVCRVARSYLKPESMTVALLAPAGQEGVLSPQVVQAAARQARSLGCPQAAAAEDSAPTVGRWVLPNGMRLIIKENPGSGTVAVQAAVLGGLRYEEPRQAGIADFAAAMLTKGTATRDVAQIATLVDSMAAGLSGFSGRNSMGLTGDFLAEHFDEGLALFAEVLRAPAFDPAEVEKMRTLLLAAIRSRQDNLAAVALDLFNAALHGPHPYGRTLLGDEETVRSIKPQELAAFWRRHVQPDGLVLTVVGDVAAEGVRDKVARLFGDWQGQPAAPPHIPGQSPPKRVVRVSKVRDERNQVNMLLGFPGATFKDGDRCALDVLDAALSSQGGRLFVRLRDQLGLAYSVSCFSQVGIEPGSFAVYIATSPEKRQEALQELKRQLRLAREGLSPEELARAKRFVVGTYEIGLQSNSAQASSMGLDELYGLGYDYGPRYVAEIEKVSAADVRRVARRYIQLQHYLLAEVGPAGARASGRASGEAAGEAAQAD